MRDWHWKRGNFDTGFDKYIVSCFCQLEFCCDEVGNVIV